MPKRTVIALLGGGQLGRMFIENALRYDAQIHVLDHDAHAPCAGVAQRFVQGSFRDPETVIDFARDADVVSIEIEHVDVGALETLAAMGKRVIPDPKVLRTIQDKGLQKQFYAERGIPTAPFVLVEDRAGLREHGDRLPAFLKARTGGYDGKGVMALDSPGAIDEAFDGPYLLEDRVEVERELAVVVARGLDGSLATYPVVEMVFDPELNLVDHLIAPATVDAALAEEAQSLARRVVEGLDSPGVFAVELFCTAEGRLLVNETAPRVHNSGHFSIEACASSQFDQMLRVLMGWPLGDTTLRGCAAMVNLVGEGGEGPARVCGLDQVLAIPGAHVHFYAKAITRTGRKMGHVTLTDTDREALRRNIAKIRRGLQIVPIDNPKRATS